MHFFRENQDESLGGNYGESSPFDLGFTFTAEEGSACSVDSDFSGSYSNSLSAFSMAEMTRRIVLHREIGQQNRWPGMQWADAQAILYGAENTEASKFPQP